jgi:hypothetical protein
MILIIIIIRCTLIIKQFHHVVNENRRERRKLDEKFQEEFDSLLSNYTELLLGEENEELKEKVQVWMLYTYMSKNMPGLVKHWNAKFPDGKQTIVQIVSEIKKMNEIRKQNQK